MTPFETRDVVLHDWQVRAVEAWVAGEGGQGFRGTLEIVTGGGKTLISLACAARAAEQDPDMRLAVVVPTEALARQWRTTVLEHTHLPPEEVGMLGGGGQDSLNDKRALIAVINTASKRLPVMASTVPSLMLIVDECHRAGAPGHSRVLTARSAYRLGLSATPDREELDEDGEPLAYDDQVVGRALGGVVYRFSLRDARLAGWLPRFTLHHHGVSLLEDERRRYDAVSRRVDDAAEDLRGLGADTSRARQLSARADELGEAARTWVRLTSKRKDLLYRAGERRRVATELMRDAVEARDGGESPRAILFHERVDQAAELHACLVKELPDLRVELEHSRLPDARRREALQAFRTGDAEVLVSVKSLVEGLDVPQADIGISVASTSSVRQRVQSLGRVLRRSTDAAGAEKSSTMHLIYVADSVDELIYGKADWTDLTGEDANRYWLWPLGEARVAAPGPPLSPLPTEDQAWDALGRTAPETPLPWPGVVTGQEYTVSTGGVVHNAFGHQVANPQNAGAFVEAVRGRPGGRFRVTPENRLVLVWPGGPERSSPMLAGRLSEPFRAAEEVVAEVSEDKSSADLSPGEVYRGPSDRKRGSYRLGQRAGGIIERRTKSGKELALTAGSGQTAKERNATLVLRAWHDLGKPMTRFFMNENGHAWYEDGGERRFLADVAEGFAWPTDTDEEHV